MNPEEEVNGSAWNDRRRKYRQFRGAGALCRQRDAKQTHRTFHTLSDWLTIRIIDQQDFASSRTNQ